MIAIQKSADRGYANHGWLKSYHSFSFASYYNPQKMGFRDLRVINEDYVDPGKGFATHSHRDMEIVSYVLEGGLEHKDSMGNTAIIYPGEVQIMSAGTGVSHSEYNPSSQDLVHLLQIWILPDTQGLTPRYEQKKYPNEEKQNQLRLVVSPDGRDGSVTIHQDAKIYASLLDTGKQVEHQLGANRHAWIQLITGEIVVNDSWLVAGDAVAISEQDKVAIAAQQNSEFLLFDLA
jgi:redox-sensitive bicupin YhaK (pirin superfamily)